VETKIKKIEKKFRGIEEVKKEFESYLLDGIIEDGLIIKFFSFDIPDGAKKFFDIVKENISYVTVFLDFNISDSESAVFLLNYAGGFTEFMQQIYEIDQDHYKVFPEDLTKCKFGVNIFFDDSKLSSDILSVIKNYEHIFNKKFVGQGYFSLQICIKNFTIDFIYCKHLV